MSLFANSTRPLVIGMLHLRPLPGSPRYAWDLPAIRDAILTDAETLVAGGVDALMLENFGDTPFWPDHVPIETVAHMTSMAAAVRAQFADTPLGINVLRNDGCAALAIAHAVGAQFIRVNILTGARLTDQGIVQGCAASLLRLRTTLGANLVSILGDVNVKHSAPLAAQAPGAGYAIEDEVRDLVERGGADGVIVSGTATGSAADVEELRRVHAVVQTIRTKDRTPIFVGSGVNAENVQQYLPWSSGVIVGTSLKRGGKVDEPVVLDRVRNLVAKVKER